MKNEELIISSKKIRLCIDQDSLSVDSLYICAAHRYKLG